MTRRRVVAVDNSCDEISLYSDPDGGCNIEATVNVRGYDEEIEIILNKENQMKLGKALLHHAEHGSLEGLE